MSVEDQVARVLVKELKEHVIEIKSDVKEMRRELSAHKIKVAALSGALSLAITVAGWFIKKHV